MARHLFLESTLVLLLLPIVGGCSGSKSTSDDANSAAAKSGSQSASPGKSKVEGSEGKRNNQNNTEQIALRLAGEWDGNAEIVDQAALKRFAETTNANPDPAKRAEAVKEFVTSTTDLYKGMKHVLVFKKDGSYAKTSWGTGAYSDGKPQSGTWKITKSTGSRVEITLAISGSNVPYVLEFKNDNELTLRVSETMPRYNDFNRAVAERYKRKLSKKGQ